MRYSSLLCLAVCYTLSTTSTWASAERRDERRVVYVSGSTRKVCQLTGDWDRALKRPTLSLTSTRAGVVGTDLGSSFEHNGRLYFLFGDTWGRPGARDAIAWTASADCRKIELKFFTSPDWNVDEEPE